MLISGREAVRILLTRGAVTGEAFVSGRLELSGWDRPWFTILPRGRHTRA